MHVDEIQSEDAVYVLTYSIIMLNTDLHNPQVRVRLSISCSMGPLITAFWQKRMTIEDYQKNLRGVNNGSDFTPEFLVRTFDETEPRLISCKQNIYDSIRKAEIVMPEEHSGQLGFEYAWKALSSRSRDAGAC